MRSSIASSFFSVFIISKNNRPFISQGRHAPLRFAYFNHCLLTTNALSKSVASSVFLPFASQHVQFARQQSQLAVLVSSDGGGFRAHRCILGLETSGHNLFKGARHFHFAERLFSNLDFTDI